MSSSIRSTTLARLFAGVSAAAALAVAAPVFADTNPQATSTTVVPTEKPAMPTAAKTVDKTTDSKSGAATTDMKGSSDAKAPATPAKSSDADQAGSKAKTKVASDDSGVVKHHHKAKASAKPSTEKADTSTTTEPAGK